MSSNRKLTRACMAAFAAAGMAMAVPPAAGAATLGVTGTTLTFQAAPGSNNNYVPINRSDSPGQPYRVYSGGESLLVGTGCTPAPPSDAAFCPIPPVTRIVMLMGGGADTVILAAPGLALDKHVQVPTRINGGSGNDQLTAGEGADVIIAGSGINTVRGAGGNDRLLMRNGQRDALIDCGDGVDTAIIDRVDPRPIACETVLRPG